MAEELGFQILRAIRRIIRRTSEYSRNLGKSSGVSVPQLLCLKAISEFPSDTEVTVAMVADSVQLSAATVSRILDRLERGGFILRERRSADRRKVCLSLTQKGRDQYADLPTPLHDQFLERLEQLDATERLALLKALETIVELMDAQRLDAAPVLTPELEVGQSGAARFERESESGHASPAD
jgi:DNA-binding MarR family transcriptional regulator